MAADGDVTHADAEEYLDAVEGCGAIAYRKLCDGRAGNLVMSLATADRPLKLFTSVAPAQRWIDTLVPAQ